MRPFSHRMAVLLHTKTLSFAQQNASKQPKLTKNSKQKPSQCIEKKAQEHQTKETESQPPPQDWPPSPEAALGRHPHPQPQLPLLRHQRNQLGRSSIRPIRRRQDNRKT